MTWNTSTGDRVLGGAEGALVREVLYLMADELAESIEESDQDDEFEIGVDAFEALTMSAKLATLRLVAEHLLEETAETLDLTAVNESAVYAIFRTLFSGIEIEIDIAQEMPDEESALCCYWRSLALNAWREVSLDESDPSDESLFIPNREISNDLEQWDFLTEKLADCILWDRDFEMNGLFLDEAPELAQLKKQFLGIEDNYYSEMAPDIKPDQIETTLESLRTILRKPR